MHPYAAVDISGSVSGSAKYSGGEAVVQALIDPGLIDESTNPVSQQSLIDC